MKESPDIIGSEDRERSNRNALLIYVSLCIAEVRTAELREARVNDRVVEHVCAETSNAPGKRRGSGKTRGASSLAEKCDLELGPLAKKKKSSTQSLVTQLLVRWKCRCLDINNISVLSLGKILGWSK